MRFRMITGFAAAILIISCGALAAPESGTQEYVYAIEIGGVLCGYSEATTTPVEREGRELVEEKIYFFVKINALGSTFDSEVRLTYLTDPATGAFTYHDSEVDQADVHLDSAIRIEGDTALVTSSLAPDEKKVYLPAGTVLETYLFHPHLKSDFGDQSAIEKTYRIFDVREQAVHEVTYSKRGTERLELAGKEYDAIRLERLDRDNGLKITLWIDAATGLQLKSAPTQDRLTYLADASVKKEIRVASLDDDIITPAGIMIADYRSISYMKVEAVMQPSGVRLSPAALDVPGQRFAGTVVENLVDGIFEIEHPRYDGAGAPPFPTDHAGADSLARFLEPEDMIESDDPVLMEKAREITAGATDSWEAAKRLSSWVAENIEYAIPGGGNARNTYDIRAGECGAHSHLLAAFCRSVGIPARVVWGCMYIPERGGGFGQHAWNEIWMGHAGWVPVDATAFETDYLDSGHIRLGVYSSPYTAFGGKRMKVVEHRLRSDDSEGTSVADSRYAQYLGSYTNTRNGNVATVKESGGALIVEIPGATTFPLADPDETGRWKSMIGHRIYFEFTRGEDGAIEEMVLTQEIPMEKRSNPDDIADDIPDEYLPYLGDYYLRAVNADFTVLYVNNCLAVNDPLEKQVVGLRPPDAGGRWIDQYGKNAITFERAEDGNVTSMTIHSINRFVRNR